jgi:enamine deaminase RidA (YjgF/YER057c/UK114 family)
MRGVTHGPNKALRSASRADDAAAVVRGADGRPAVRLGHPRLFEAQFGFVVCGIKRVLDEAGASFHDLVKVNVLLTRAY